MMHPFGTFDYVFTVPPAARDAPTWQGSLRRPLPADEKRLAGHAPQLTFTDTEGHGQLLTRLRLTPAEHRSLPRRRFPAWTRRTVEERRVEFSIPRSFVALLISGDQLLLWRAGCAGLGVSALRGTQLLAAAGALSQMSLGAGINVRAVTVADWSSGNFAHRDGREHAVSVTADGETQALTRGRWQVGQCDVLVRNGFIEGMPGTDESLAMAPVVGGRFEVAMSTAALLKDGCYLEMWEAGNG